MFLHACIAIFHYLHRCSDTFADCRIVQQVLQRCILMLKQVYGQVLMCALPCDARDKILQRDHCTVQSSFACALAWPHDLHRQPTVFHSSASPMRTDSLYSAHIMPWSAKICCRFALCMLSLVCASGQHVLYCVPAGRSDSAVCTELFQPL